MEQERCRPEQMAAKTPLEHLCEWHVARQRPAPSETPLVPRRQKTGSLKVCRPSGILGGARSS